MAMRDILRKLSGVREPSPDNPTGRRMTSEEVELHHFEESERMKMIRQRDRDVRKKSNQENFMKDNIMREREGSPFKLKEDGENKSKKGKGRNRFKKKEEGMLAPMKQEKSVFFK